MKCSFYGKSGDFAKDCNAPWPVDVADRDMLVEDGGSFFEGGATTADLFAEDEVDPPFEGSSVEEGMEETSLLNKALHLWHESKLSGR